MSSSLHDRLLSAQNQVDPEGGVEGCRRALLSSGLLCFVGDWSHKEGQFLVRFELYGGEEWQEFELSVPIERGGEVAALSWLWSCWLHGLLGLVPPEKSSGQNDHLIEEPASVASKPAGSRIRVGP